MKLGVINRQILRIAIPAIIANITTPLLSLADVAIVGHIGSAAYIGAIAVGGTMFNILYWLFGFLRMGTSGITAQALGGGADTHVVLWRSLVLAAVGGLALIALSAPVGEAVLTFMDADSVTAPLARRYFGIVICGAPAVLVTFALSGWLLGCQNSRTPMWIALITNIINIAVSLVLVVGIGMRIEGVAAGTVAAQYAGALCGLVAVRVKYRPRRVAVGDIVDRRALAAFFKINSDIFLRTVCLVAVTLWFTHAGASQGSLILAANALLLQFFLLFSYFMDGFAFAGEALAGKYYGAGDTASLRAVIAALLRWGRMLAAVFAILYFIGGSTALDLLTDNRDVTAAAREYLPWAVAVPVAGTMAFVYDGIFIGLTLTRRMLVAMATATAVFFVLYFSLRSALGNHALWLAFIAYQAMRGGAQWSLLRQWPELRRRQE